MTTPTLNATVIVRISRKMIDRGILLGVPLAIFASVFDLKLLVFAAGAAFGAAAGGYVQLLSVRRARLPPSEVVEAQYQAYVAQREAFARRTCPRRRGTS